MFEIPPADQGCAPPVQPASPASPEPASPAPTASPTPLSGLTVLCVDVETLPAEDNRIFKLGALRSDHPQGLLTDIHPASIPQAAQVIDQLNQLARGVDLIAGHHLRRHDLPALTAQPLELSTLVFPQQSSHRLFKDYKVVSDTRNDPLSDARVSLDLLNEEIEALRQLNLQHPRWTGVLHFLLQDDPGLHLLMTRLRSRPAPSLDFVSTVLPRLLGDVCCATRLMPVVQALLTAPLDQRWALAQTLSWLRVAAGTSVLPHWVRATWPQAGALIHELRAIDCGDHAHCSHCARHHHPEALLQQHFGLPGFRAMPASPRGGSCSARSSSPASTGPAGWPSCPPGTASRSATRCRPWPTTRAPRQLTVIVSPLQSLMKDQVDNLVRQGVQCTVTLNGMLTPPERRAALDKIRLGEAGIVLVSPEQFRNRAFAEALRLRQIATWVFDEAHCLSRWGQDFRTDYLYVARFIREHFPGVAATVACFTATARQEVISDLTQHFRDKLGIELRCFLGGHERTNLSYRVITATRAEKGQHLVELLTRGLRDHVMREYARLGVQDIDAAQDFVATYFSWPRGKFLRKYFGGRTELLRQATTDDSYRRIIQALQHPGQEALVTKPGPGNRFVLAGPGSGKTRVIVHRIAALLRVHRGPAPASSRWPSTAARRPSCGGACTRWSASDLRRKWISGN